MTDISVSLRKLEEMALHQERHIQDLSDMVAAHWQEIDLLKKRVQVLHNKLNAVVVDVQDGGQEGLSVTEIALRDKPPHY